MSGAPDSAVEADQAEQAEQDDSPEALIAALEDLSDQMGQAIDGVFDFRVSTDCGHASIQKLAVLVNFLIQNAASALDRASDSNERLSHQLEERRALEEVLRQKIAEAMEADRIKSMFFATMHHELRTPMNAILGMSALLARMSPEAEPEEIADFAAHLHDGASRLGDLIEQSLQFSQIEAGRTEIRAEPVTAADLVATAIRQAERAASARRIRIATPAEGLTLMLWCDPVLIGRALANLVANAVKFSPEGSRVTVSVRAEPAGRKGGDGRVGIEIEDEGPGMSAEQIRQALKPFRQLEEGMSRRHEGAGMGLAIADALIRQNDGELRLQPAARGGLRATVLLPHPKARRDALSFERVRDES